MDGEESVGKYVTSTRIRKTFGVSNTTLRNWAEAGRVQVVRIGGSGSGRRLYLKEDTLREFPGYRPHNEDGRAAAAATRRKVCYTRVSSAKQKEDLERQVSAVRQDFPEHEIVSDVGSGLNWKRPGFLRILNSAMQGTVAEVVVANRD